MNPKIINDSRSFVWTVSETVKNTYCIYINGSIYSENLSLDDFVSLYNSIRKAQS